MSNRTCPIAAIVSSSITGNCALLYLPFSNLGFPGLDAGGIQALLDDVGF